MAIKWKQVDEARYWEMLGCLPPAVHLSRGFLVGEPWDHDRHGRPRFSAFFCTRPDEFEKKIHGMQEGYFESLRPLTVDEFHAVTLKDIRANLISEFDAGKLQINRKRFSTTQGEVELIYAGTRLQQFGDEIKLDAAGQWQGLPDAFWTDVAKRFRAIDKAPIT